MTSPLDSTHRHQRRAWHDIASFGQHTRSNVRRDMPSLLLDSTHGRTMSGVAYYHCLWAAHTVERRWAWHVIIAIGWQTRSNDVRRGMPSSPLGSTNGQTTSGVACHHRLWTTHTVSNVKRGMTLLPLECTHGWQRRAWHDLTALRKHTRSATSGVL